jgi:cysteine synthase
MTRPADAAPQTHGQGSTVCGHAIGSWSGSRRIEFEINLVTEVLPAAATKARRALGVIEAAERAGQLRLGQTVIEATSGNIGIGRAMVCIFREAKLGLLDAT